jgi:hypothetical protein
MSQTIDSREWLWLYEFGNLCKNEETMTYFETHESEKTKYLLSGKPVEKHSDNVAPKKIPPSYVIS